MVKIVRKEDKSIDKIIRNTVNNSISLDLEEKDENIKLEEENKLLWEMAKAVNDEYKKALNEGIVKNCLQSILKERGLKKIWLADKVDIHRGTMSNIISNKYNPSLAVALKISKILDLKVEDIFELIEDDVK